MNTRPLAVRFWEKVRKTDGCWIWTGATLHGYGRIKAGPGNRPAHAISWEIHRSPVPGGMFVCHHCDNPSCVNPEHLFVGTPKDNTQDARRKGRLGAPEKTHCPRGHAYVGENIYMKPSYKPGTGGYRDCRTCRNARADWYNRRGRGEPIPAHWTELLSARSEANPRYPISGRNGILIASHRPK